MPRNRAAQSSLALAIAGAALFMVMFAIMWGPVYLFGSDSGLILYPLVLAGFPILECLAILAIIFAAIGLERAPRLHDGRRRAACALTLAILLALLSFPALWFGNAALFL